MPLIRNQQAGALLNHARALDLGDMRAEARRIVDDARAEADRIVKDAFAEAADVLNTTRRDAQAQGREMGHAEGLEAGLEEGRERGHREALENVRPHVEQLVSAWTEQLHVFERARDALLDDAQRNLILFALELARRVIVRSIELDPTIVHDQVVEAVELLGRPTSLRVRLHPDDVAVFDEGLDGLIGRIDGTRDVRVEVSEDVARGGCVLETDGGRVDATLETQLERIARTLLPGSPGARPNSSAVDPESLPARPGSEPSRSTMDTSADPVATGPGEPAAESVEDVPNDAPLPSERDAAEEHASDERPPAEPGGEDSEGERS